MKYSIVMPTYNDSDSIVETLDSIRKQTYKNWELWIIDDGSTDNTKKVVKNYIKKYNKLNINYIYQTNKDQLNAILNVIDKITGDYVYILHSDDLFADNNILKKVNNDLIKMKSDVLYANQSLIIDEASKITGKQKFPTYNKKDYIMAIQMLWLGRNLYWDFAFFKREIFKTDVRNNYLIWNTPFWLNYKDGATMLNVDTARYSFIKYRVFEGNYINNEIGKLNVINGELRTATRLMKYFNIPLYKHQYIVYRIFNKLRLNNVYIPIYNKKETTNKKEVIEFIINKRYGNDYSKYLFLNSIYNFYAKETKRCITIKNISENEFIYLGSDVRKFNNDMLKNNLSALYINILNEMNEGFDEIKTTNQDYEKVLNIVKFLCLYPHVKITIENKR